MRLVRAFLFAGLCVALAACQSDEPDGADSDGPAPSWLDADGEVDGFDDGGRRDPPRLAVNGIASRDAAKTRAERMAEARRIAGLYDEAEQPRDDLPGPIQERRVRRRTGNPARAVKVVWEALARERYLLENPRHRRRINRAPEFRIVLVNESHPDAEGMRNMAWSGDQDGGHAVLSDKEMVDFLKGLEKVGYFKAARDTASQARLFQSDSARGRVTIERQGRTLTLLSMRGQGLDPRTKHIPPIYSQAKQAIALLRNRAPTLSVETSGRR